MQAESNSNKKQVQQSKKCLIYDSTKKYNNKNKKQLNTV